MKILAVILGLVLAQNSFADAVLRGSFAFRGSFNFSTNVPTGGGGGGGSAPTLVSTSALDTDLIADDPETFAFTTGAIVNGCVVACFAFTKATTITACDVNGTAMTKLAYSSHADGTTRAEIWGVKIASLGAGTYNVNPSGTSGAHFKGVALSWNGVNQTTPFGAGATNTATSASPTIAITSGANDIVIGVFAADGTGTFTFTAGSGFTTIFNTTTTDNIDHLSQYKQAATTVDATLSGSATWAGAAVQIQP